LGAKQVVFHASAHPFLRGQYLDTWAGRCADFYSDLAETYGLGIRVENSQDIDCTPLLKLMQRVRKADVAVCLDVGHAHYSFEPMEKWFDVLGEYIQYMHLSDNMGRFDDHLPIGSGSIDWEKIDGMWRSLGRNMPMTLEVGGITGVEESLRFLRKNGYFGMGV
jgi:sugar phosphate isomerase/epimerase